jgi:polyphosphate:AMP phosphotransferase
MLAKDGVLLLKFWLHISKKTQKKRLKKLEKNPETRWRVSETDWKFFRKYDRFRKVSEKALQKTHRPGAPWRIVEAEDDQYRHLTVAKTLLKEIRAHLARPPAPKPIPDRPKPGPRNALRRLKLDQPTSRDEYEERLPLLQAKINRLSRKLSNSGRSLILVFEGNDAAGKGGTIRRLVRAIDTRLFRVIPVAAPTDEEKARPYLWRFWRHLPMPGRVTVFDRSWYGRVLVERVEGFCRKSDWERAYGEIRDFEEQLTRKGNIVIKFWLAISKDEQLRRFKQREEVSWKRYKITEEDWRNREKWDAYEASACDMFEKTGSPDAPWVTVESDNKLYGRLKVLQTVADRLEKELG